MRGAGSEGHPQIPRSRTDSRRPHLKRIHHPPCSAASLACSSDPNAEGGWGAGVQCPHPAPHQHIAARGSGASQELTLRQACPGPDGPGRNLRSKTRWFAGFCNSHQVSHFATFFIDARAEISVAESRFDLNRIANRPPNQALFPAPRRHGSFRCFSLTRSAPGFVRRPRALARATRLRRRGLGVRCHPSPPRVF